MPDPNPADPSSVDPLQSLIADFLDAEGRGQPLDRDHWLAQHTSYADSLREFLANHDRMKRSASTPDDATIPPQSHAYNDETLAPDYGTSLRTPAAAVRKGQGTFGDYELLEEIARGGMGVVYKARQIKLNRTVALKMILAGQWASEQDIQRFRTEAEAAANLDHSGIVSVYEVGQYDGQHFLSMAYIDGQSLADKISAGPIPFNETAMLLLKISEAIGYAHQHGVIHRDLKPANILLDRTKQPKITDFGLAKMTGSESNLTGTGEILGTPSYMAPEQARGRVTDIGPAADIYSLGAILYCCLTGRPPFQSSNILDTLFEVLEKEPTPPRAVVPNIPVDLESICLKCLAKDPSERYSSAQVCAEDFKRFIRGEPVHAASLSRMRRLFVWSRNRPALFVTWVCLAALYGNHFFFAHILQLPKHRGWFDYFTTSLIAVWAALAYYFQSRLTRRPEDRFVQLAWPIAEVALLFIFLLGANGAASPIATGFFVLIAGSALREPAKLIWFVTLGSVAAYLCLQLHAIIMRPAQSVPLATAIPTIIFMLAIGLIQFTLIRKHPR